MHGWGLIAATRQLDQVNAQVVEHDDHLLGIVRAEAAALEVGRIELDRDRETGAHGRTHLADHVDEQAGAVFKRATPAVDSLVGQRREELTEQVAVRSVDLNPIEACRLGQH